MLTSSRLTKDYTKLVIRLLKKLRPTPPTENSTLFAFGYEQAKYEIAQLMLEELGVDGGSPLLKAIRELEQK